MSAYGIASLAIFQPISDFYLHVHPAPLSDVFPLNQGVAVQPAGVALELKLEIIIFFKKNVAKQHKTHFIPAGLDPGQTPGCPSCSAGLSCGLHCHRDRVCPLQYIEPEKFSFASRVEKQLLAHV